jgi:protein subunit release factor B
MFENTGKDEVSIVFNANKTKVLDVNLWLHINTHKTEMDCKDVNISVVRVSGDGGQTYNFPVM